MPRLTTATEATTKLQFLLSAPMDLMNSMYFTALAGDIEGIDGWPQQVRREMAPDLLAELDFLYNYPAGDPGIVGTLTDNLFTHPELWPDIASLAPYVRGLSAGEAGIQGIIYETTFRHLEEPERAPCEGLPQRVAVERRMRSLGDRDAEAIMAFYDRPEELRERMARLIERFYDEHYRQELPRRWPALERSVAAHRGETGADPVELTRRLTARPKACLEDTCAGGYTKLIFAPSVDMGPYTSCSVIDGIHGLFYPCEAEFISGGDADAAETQRLARVYKALSDEQRLRILRLLREREMYAQEIVERTGLHQSVVSRHLTFMRVVGLLNVRPENNMKFYSINNDMRELLGRTLDLFVPASNQGGAP